MKAPRPSMVVPENLTYVRRFAAATPEVTTAVEAVVAVDRQTSVRVQTKWDGGEHYWQGEVIKPADRLATRLEGECAEEISRDKAESAALSAGRHLPNLTEIWFVFADAVYSHNHDTAQVQRRAPRRQPDPGVIQF